MSDFKQSSLCANIRVSGQGSASAERLQVNFSDAQSFEPGDTMVSGLQKSQTAPASCRDHLPGFYTAVLVHQVYEDDSATQRIASWVATLLLQHRLSIDFKRNAKIWPIKMRPAI